MKWSYSRVSTFELCPKQFEYRYLNVKKELLPQERSTFFEMGEFVHLGLETNTDNAIQSYLHSYPILTDDIITESIKIEHMIEKTKSLLQEND